MLAMLFALLVIYAWWAPTSWSGRILQEFTEGACRWFASIRLLTIICFVVFVATLIALVAYGQIDGLIMAALAAPEGFATFLAFDVGTAVEALAICWLASLRGSLTAAAGTLRSARHVLGGFVRARSGRRTRRSPRRPANANDDDPAPWLDSPLALAA